MKTLADMLNDRDAKLEQGAWTPACGGTEEPFTTRNGRHLLYVYQATTGRHAYLDMRTDIVLSAEESALALGV